MKHIEIDSHFIREKIDSKELLLPYTKLENQLSDTFTKGFSCGVFEKNVNKLGIFIYIPNLRDIVEGLDPYGSGSEADPDLSISLMVGRPLVSWLSIVYVP